MFINLTPHMIRIVGTNLETQEEQFTEVAPSGKVAIRRPKMGETVARRLDQFEFYVSSRSLGPVLVLVQDRMGGEPREEEFPKRAEGVIYLVSSMVQEALGSCPDVLAPDTGPTAIRDEKGNVWAVVGLIGPE
jgi:hypothetical protein